MLSYRQSVAQISAAQLKLGPELDAKIAELQSRYIRLGDQAAKAEASRLRSYQLWLQSGSPTYQRSKSSAPVAILAIGAVAAIGISLARRA